MLLDKDMVINFAIFRILEQQNNKLNVFLMMKKCTFFAPLCSVDNKKYNEIS